MHDRDCAPEGAREWWGIVSREHWTPDMQVRAERVACTRMATTLAVWYSAGSPPTTTTRAGRIHDALGVEPIHFESGYLELV